MKHKRIKSTRRLSAELALLGWDAYKSGTNNRPIFWAQGPDGKRIAHVTQTGTRYDGSGPAKPTKRVEWTEVPRRAVAALHRTITTAPTPDPQWELLHRSASWTPVLTTLYTNAMLDNANLTCNPPLVVAP